MPGRSDPLSGLRPTKGLGHRHCSPVRAFTPLPLRYLTVLNCCRTGRKPSHEFSCSICGKASQLRFIDMVVPPGLVKQPTEEEDGVGAIHPVAAEVNLQLVLALR